MENQGYQRYREQQDQNILSMNPQELLLALYDGLVKQLILCDLALKKENYELLEEAADRSIAILRYLDDTLDMRYPISRELHRLYDFYSYEMGRVKIGRNREVLDKVRPMITDLRTKGAAARSPRSRRKPRWSEAPYGS